MIVADASAIVELLLNSQRGRAVSWQLRAARSVHAPHLLDLEVLQTIRRFLATGDLAAGRAAEAVTDFQALEIHRAPHDLFVGRIWELRDNLTAYDAAYVALAETLPAKLLTCDQQMARVAGNWIDVQSV